MSKVSIIVPVYNAEKFLDKCIESILNQTYSDYELILVDDGSTDASGEICDRFQSYNKKICVLHKENGGVSSARKVGIKKAKGEYLAFVDSDDWIEPDFLEKMMEELEKSCADMLVSGCTKEKNGVLEHIHNNIAAGTYEGSNLYKVYEKMLYFRGFFEFGILPYLWNKIFRRELFLETALKVDDRIYDGEDAAQVFAYMLGAEKIRIIEDSKYHYVLRDSSITSRKKNDYYENVSRLYLCMHDICKKSGYYNILLPQLNQYMRKMVWQMEPGRFPCNAGYLFPFGRIPFKSNIVLYAAGSVGKTYCRQVEKTEYCNLIAWVDKNYESDYMQAMGVEDIGVVKKRQFDYVVIAVADEEQALQIKRQLLELGVEDRKVIWGEDGSN